MSKTEPPTFSIVTDHGLTPRKSDRTRQALLDAALEFLWTRPFRDMTVAEVVSTIEQQQAQGLIAAFDARPVAVSLNQLDVATLINAFGRHPRSDPNTVCNALTRIWTSTLYGPEQVSECREPK